MRSAFVLASAFVVAAFAIGSVNSETRPQAGWRDARGKLAPSPRPSPLLGITCLGDAFDDDLGYIYCWKTRAKPRASSTP